MKSVIGDNNFIKKILSYQFSMYPYCSFSNYYINIFNLLLLLDINKDSSEKTVTFIYDGSSIAILKEPITTQNLKKYMQEIMLYNKRMFTKYNNNEMYSSVYYILHISQETCNRVLDSKLLTYKFDRDYDRITEILNQLSIIAQNNLSEYIRKFLKQKHSIIDLFKEIILKYSDITNQEFFYKVSLYDEDVKKEVDYYINNYNTIYKYFYLDSLTMIALYIKNMLLFQSATNIKDTTNDKESLRKVLALLSLSRENFTYSIYNLYNRQYKISDNIKDTKPLIHSNNGIFGQTLSTFNIDNGMQLANTIFNLMYHLNDINEMLEANDKLSIYFPDFETISNKRYKKPLSRLLYSLSKLEYITELNKKNIKDIAKKAFKSKSRLSYGEIVVTSNIDPNGTLLNIVGNDELFSEEDIKLGYSAFQGYIQNNNTMMYNATRAQYLSTVWLRPLFQEELYTSGTHQTHFLPRLNPTLESKHIDRKAQSFNRYLYYSGYTRIYESRPYIPYHIHSILNTTYCYKNTGLPINKSNSGAKYIYENTIYKTSLASVILLRMYMLSILELISRTINCDIIPITETNDINFFNEYYYKSDTTNKNLIKDFKKLSTIKIFEDNGDFYEYPIQYMEWLISFNLETLQSSNKPIWRKFSTEKFENTFAIYMNDSLKVNENLLMMIYDIAKEDIISCPTY